MNVPLLAALIAGLSSISLFHHWRRRGRDEALMLAVLAAGTMLTLTGV
ncbi:hypothetical protein [Actibacterium sp. D379-3]